MNEVDQAFHLAAPPIGDGVEECWMDFDGARMRYLKAGTGPPLVLLHGLFGYSFSWRYTIPALAPYATVYVPDMLGAGFSDRPQIDHCMRATALRVLKFLERLGISSFNLLGTSRGGAVAMCAAAECVSGNAALKVENLILVAPVNPYSAHGRWIALFFATSIGSACFRWTVDTLPSLFPFFHARLYASREKIPSGSLEGYRAPLAKPGLVNHALSIVKTWGADLAELESLLPKLSAIPTLIMWGMKDPAVYCSSMEPLARYFPNAEKVVFQGIGHLPYEECPEEFNRALISFLTRDRGAGMKV